MVRCSPSSNWTTGSQPSTPRAIVMSRFDHRARPGQPQHCLGQLPDGELVGVAHIGGFHPVTEKEPHDPVDKIRGVAEGASLGSIAVHRERLTPERLHDEIRNHPAIAGAHPGPVGVEDPDDPGVHLVVAMVGHGERLTEPLGLIVHAARTHRIDMTPVILGLGMHLGIAVHLRGRRQEEPGALGLGQAQRLVGPERADLQGLDGQFQIIDRAGR
jgi:hypothetical protein